MSKEELKMVGQIRKAIMPLLELMKTEANQGIDDRLTAIETSLIEIAKRDFNVEVKAPEVNVTVETPEELTKTIKKMAEPVTAEPVEVPSAYEPHDQAKTGTFQYSGFMRSNGDYYIQRVAKGEQRYFKGSGDYAEAWAKRDKLTYGYISGDK